MTTVAHRDCVAARLRRQRFWPLVELEQVEGRSRDWRAVQHAQKTPGRRGLRLLQYDTPAHHAAKVLANTMETDLWLDVR